MNTQTMTGLLGANANLNLMATPMRVYNEATIKGETEKQERAMSYVNEFADKAQQYNSYAAEGLEVEAREAKEEQAVEREQAQCQLNENSEARNTRNESVQLNSDGDSAEISEAAKESAQDAPEQTKSALNLRAAAKNTEVKSAHKAAGSPKVKATHE